MVAISEDEAEEAEDEEPIEMELIDVEAMPETCGYQRKRPVPYKN